MALSALAPGEGGLGRKQRLGRKRCEHHEIDAEADIDGFDPIREEAREMRRLAAWRAQASVDDGGGAVGAIDRKLKAPRAAAGKGERLAKLFRKMIEAGDDAFMGNQRLGEGKPRRVVWRGEKGAARLLAPPKRLVEAREHGFGRLARVEPPLERGARQIVKLADALQAEALEQPRDLLSRRKASTGRGAKASPIFPCGTMREEDPPVARKRMSASQGLGKGKSAR